MEERIRQCKEIDVKIEDLQTAIVLYYRNKPFNSYTYKSLILTLNNYGLSEFDNEDRMLEDLSHSFKSITLKDLIIGYFNIKLILSMYKKDKDVDIKNFFKGPDAKILKKIKTLSSNEHDISTFEHQKEYITSIFKKYGFPIVKDIYKSMIKSFMKLRKKKIEFLPPIKSLLVHDTLFLINRIHSDVEMEINNDNVTNLDKVQIPESMNFYRIMASEYGSASCSEEPEVDKFISKIQKYILLNSPRKNTEKNNIKFIKRISRKLLKKTENFMRDYTKKLLNSAANFSPLIPQVIQFTKAVPHVHFFKNSNFINKEHAIELYDGQYTLDKISVVNDYLDFDEEYSINLVDYLKLFDSGDGRLTFNTSDIIELLENEGIKFVLYIDMSCSGFGDINTNNISPLKRRAKEIEGNSITSKIRNYVNSPYENSLNRRSKKSARRAF